MNEIPDTEEHGPRVPSNEDAEQLILGAVVFDPSCIDQVVHSIRPDQFFYPKNRRCFEALVAMRARGIDEFSTVTIEAELRSRGTFDDVGKKHLDLTFVKAAQWAPHPDHYITLVKEAYQRRTLLQVGQELVFGTRDPSCDIEDLKSRAEAMLAGVISGEQQLSEAHIGRVLERAFEKIFQRMERQGGRGIPSGFANLDEITGGFHENELTIVAASAGTGKTALVCNIATAVGQWAQSQAADGEAVPQNGVVIFSFEQGDTQLGERVLSIESKVNGHHIRLGQLDQQEQFEVCAASDQLRRLPIFILDAAGLNVGGVAALARQFKTRYGIGMVIVDYLQIVTADERIGQRERQVAEISRRLKLLAKELHVPVIALSQVNKDADKRENKRPKLSDIRESGAIVADADVVMFLHRPDASDPEDRPGEADVIVAKNRSGPTGTAELVWKRESLRFADRAPKLTFNY